MATRRRTSRGTLREQSRQHGAEQSPGGGGVMAARKTFRRNVTSGDFLITTGLKKGNCNKCGAPILIGYEGGNPIRLDPSPISPLGEAAAIVGGYATFDINDESQLFGRMANWRSARKIKLGWPADRQVLASHACGRRWPTECRAAAKPLELAQDVADTPCPF